MYALYNLSLLLASPFLLGVLLFRLLTDREYRPGLPERFGFLRPVPARKPGREGPVIWFHAVSVGEVVAAQPLVRAIRRTYPRAILVLSTVTVTGQKTARLSLPEVDWTFYFPFDSPGSTKRAIRGVSPDLFIFLETELWPNFLRALSQKGIPAVLVNGRISPKSYRRYRWVRPLAKRMLSQVRLFLVQTDRDVQHLLLLGADPQKVVRTGNQKYDQAIQSVPPEAGPLRAELGIRPDDLLWIAGSTHPGEEAVLLSAYRTLLEKAPRTVLLLAPRHLDRLPAVEAQVQEAGLLAVRRRAVPKPLAEARRPMEGGARPRVILLDTLGELAKLYAAADLVFIGGSLVPIGGHNLLEAAAAGKVAFFGPHMENFAEPAAQAVAHGCGVAVKDADDLARTLGEWIDAPLRRQEGEARAREWVASQRGSVERNLDRIVQLISPG